MASADPGHSLHHRLDEMRAAERPSLVLPDRLVSARPGSVALLSGSYDPLTVGHAALAQASAGRADLVLLVFSARTLPKEGEAPPPLLSEHDRVLQLEAFCEANPKLIPAVGSHGLLADQVDSVLAHFPEAAVLVVMGSDKALQLLDPRWYENRDAVLERLFGLVRILYADRTGEEGAVERALMDAANRRWRDRFERLDIAPEVAAVSSREVRARLARGEDVGDLVPPEVHPFLHLAR